MIPIIQPDEGSAGQEHSASEEPAIDNFTEQGVETGHSGNLGQRHSARQTT
jgi:hypothetical protein